MVRSLLIGVVLLSMAPGFQSRTSVLAQQTSGGQQGAIPRDLAVELLGGEMFGMPSPELFVGKLPPGFPANVIPVGYHVLGGSRNSFGPGEGFMWIAVASTSAPRDSAIRRVRAEFERAGWKPARERPQPGFVPADFDMPSTYCKDSALANTFVSARNRATYLKVAVANMPGSLECSEKPSAAPYEGIELPRLTNPSGAQTTGGTSAGSPGIHEQSTIVESELTASRLVAHYASQLTSSGWRVGEKQTGSRLIVETFNKIDTKARPLIGILTAIPMSKPRSTLISFRVVSPDAMRQESGLFR